MVKTAAKDAQKGLRRSRLRLGAPENVDLVWQQHGLFCDAGWRLAQRTGSPFVLFVDAPQVWEAARWGVRRPLWGRAIERLDERPMFRRADVVACVTDEVAEQVVRMGADRARVLVTPCAADGSVFRPRADRSEVRERLGIPADAVVVGWVGSFRPFHGLERLLDAYAALAPRGAQVVLLLVGAGQTYAVVAERAQQSAAKIVMTGAVDHADVPGLLSAMDVGVVTAADGGAFHYSPLKLGEYMATGLAVVVPDVGNLAEVVRDKVEGCVVPAADTAALAAALSDLVAAPAQVSALGRAARERALDVLSWDAGLARTLERLDEVGPQARG